MNKYLKSFLQRGITFAGFGPIVVGIVYLVLSKTLNGFSLGGEETCLAIISTYLLAFVHAGVSVFHQIEKWSSARSLLAHMSTLYVAYVLCYLVNSWITFEWCVVGIFTAAFAVGYLAIWLIVVISVKTAERRLNRRLPRKDV